MATQSQATICEDLSSDEQCEYKAQGYDCLTADEVAACSDGQAYSNWDGCYDCGPGYYADGRFSTLVKYSLNGNQFDDVPVCNLCPSGRTSSGVRNLLEDCELNPCSQKGY